MGHGCRDCRANTAKVAVAGEVAVKAVERYKKAEAELVILALDYAATQRQLQDAKKRIRELERPG